MAKVRVYRLKKRTRREETALWAVEEALRTSPAGGRSRAVLDAVAAFLSVLEEELR